MVNVGFKLDRIPPEAFTALVRATEDSGLDEVWVVEDFGLGGGIAQSAVALAATESILVGHGIAPASVRNVMYYSMEVATLSRAFPGRFLPGIGHGMPEWLEQVGAQPESLMAALTEVTEVARRLLAGEQLTFEGSYVHVRDAALEFPPDPPPLVSLGVRGPRGLAAAGRIADGTILAEASGPAYIREARRIIDAEPHRLTVFSWLSVHDDREVARLRISEQVGAALRLPFLEFQLGELWGQSLTDSIMSEVSVSGNPEDCAAAILRLGEAGADTVVLQAPYGLEVEQMERLAAQVLPLLR